VSLSPTPRYIMNKMSELVRGTIYYGWFDNGPIAGGPVRSTNKSLG